MSVQATWYHTARRVDAQETGLDPEGASGPFEFLPIQHVGAGDGRLVEAITDPDQYPFELLQEST